MNPGICNYQSFNKAFCSILSDNSLTIEDDLISINDSNSVKNDSISLSLINTKHYLSKKVNATELISRNKDLEQKLSKVQEEANLIRKILSKDQSKLLYLYEHFSYAISILDL